VERSLNAASRCGEEEKGTARMEARGGYLGLHAASAGLSEVQRAASKRWKMRLSQMFDDFTTLKPWAVLRAVWQLSPSRLSALIVDDRPNVR